MTVNLAPAQQEMVRMGALIVAKQPTESPLPLEHTEVIAQICGPLASVAVMQRFGNPFTHAVELAYLFPLPHEAAVVDFEVRIGKRVVRAEMHELNTARQMYAQARTEGKRAGLLEQRLLNVFSLELANVQPGETINTTVRYHERLRYDDGSYEFVFPMGVTPKFHADPTAAAAVDAPIAAAGSPIGLVDLSLAVDAGATTADPISPSHQIDLTRLDSRRFSVRLAGHVVPNKDFVLRYAVASESIRATAWTSSGDGGSPAAALVTALPPRLTDEVDPAPREFLFVLDRSGSMSGGPIDQARNALRACLRALGPQDTFAIQAFDDRIEWLASSGVPAALPVTQATVEQADRWLGQIDARGGTDILEALEAALRLRGDPERRRYVVFLTDGAVSAEDAALSRVERLLGQSRLFTFGIGPSVNRGLLARMAERGRGTAEFLHLDEDIEAAIMRFQDRVAYPVLQDIQLTWEGATAWDVYPARLPDLYNGQPLEVVARFQPTGPSRLVVTGRREHELVRLEVELPSPSTSGTEPMIMSAWARARATALLDVIRDDPSQTSALRSEIIGLAIQHRLLTPYTAFVSVDTEVVAQPSDSKRVEVALPLPEGLDMDGFGGGIRGGGALGFAGMMAPPSPISAPRPTTLAGAPPPPPNMQRSRTMRPGNAPAAPPNEKADGATPDLAPFSLDDLGLRADEIASFDAPYPEPSGAAPADDADERIFSLADLGLSSEEIASLEASKAPMEPEPYDKEIEALKKGSSGGEDILRWLARRQNVDGSWGDAATACEMTAAALLVFVRSGHTTRSGHYRRQLARALKWLRAANPTDGTWEAQARAQAIAEMEAAVETNASPLDPLSTPTLPAEIDVAALAELTSLDHLRAAALTRTVRPVAPDLLRQDHSGLVLVWQAALTGER